MGRAEKDTKDKIIEAACRVLAEKGYDAASTKEIAKAAGVAQGLINYYFSSKDELFIDVLKAEGRRFCEAMQELRSSLKAEDVYKNAFDNIKDKISHYPQWYRLRYELYALGLRNNSMLEETRLQVEDSRRNISEVLSILCNKPAPELGSVAAIVFSALEGLALQKLIDERFDFDTAFNELFKMIHLYTNQ
ncbi:MAG: TetR/AcrR family transcriptional regulator [Clostridia bacterium]|nr:TetR/AcrR family transcriptional regulator [Clostridia bacterium]